MIRILSSGKVEVISGAIDMGQGTYTILAQSAAEVFGIPVDQVEVHLGDSRLPGSAIAGGSMLAGSIMGAVHKAAVAARDELIGLALSDANSPFRDTGANTLNFVEGRIAAPRGEAPSLTLAELMSALKREEIEVRRNTFPEGASAQEQVQAWLATLTMAEDLLEGRTLLPHFRIADKGINMKRFFEEPKNFDLVLSITGPSIAPYLESGKILTSDELDQIQRQFGGAGFLTFALWFN